MEDALIWLAKQGPVGVLAAVGWFLFWAQRKENFLLRNRIEQLHEIRLVEFTKSVEALAVNRELVEVVGELAQVKERRR